ncbi:MAG: 3-methyl-2-oxobutanoate hydroxymethyltransferase [Betaproteobacteria bacterium]
MSKTVDSRRITVPELAARKGGAKIVALTAYTAPMAALLDPHVDLLLVGDSVGMVLHGMPNTIGVTLEMMILHARAVMRGAQRALVAVDLPFGSYEESPAAAYRSAVRVLSESGAQAVKVESAPGIAESIAFLAARGIPVIGHVGLRPQAALVDGGFRAKGRSDDERRGVIGEAREAADAGVFALVVEGVAADLAAEITGTVQVPTIGIGASGACDGQILVTEDMLGLFEWTPRFVRRYADARGMAEQAVRAYADDVRSGRFPAEAETYAFRRA